MLRKKKMLNEQLMPSRYYLNVSRKAAKTNTHTHTHTHIHKTNEPTINLTIKSRTLKNLHAFGPNTPHIASNPQT